MAQSLHRRDSGSYPGEQRRAMSAPRSGALLLAEDRDLAADLTGEDRRAAERILAAPTFTVGTGPWRPSEWLEDHKPPGHLGFLVLDGILLRGLDLHGAACAELIGVGDVIRPWDDDSTPTLTREADWQVIAPARLAVMDRRVAAVAGRWPEVVARLLDRAVQRSHSLAFHLAVCSITRVDLRILAVLWNLADRWGRVTPEGVVLPLALTHRALGRLVTARRPSVTTALGQLRARGMVEPRSEGGWLLHGDPPEELGEILAELGSRTATT